MSFSEMGLASPLLLRTLVKRGYTTPTPIQQRAVPAVLAGQDVLAAAQTGTGKTAAFTLPILERLRQSKRSATRAPRALVLAPTRELAAQVSASVDTYGAGLGLHAAVIVGGVSPVPQIKAIRRGADILIATPGRLLDHVQQNDVDLSAIEVFVLDEADRMLDMGFLPDLRKLMAQLPPRRQNLLFSATLPDQIRRLAKTFLQNPVEIDVAPRNATVERIDQKLIYVAKTQKRELLSWLIGANNWRQVLVFTRTKHGADRLTRQLCSDGLPAMALHGNKSQGARTRALQSFKDGKVRVLVATDIAARGLDIDQLPQVINFELPNVAADYVHRIGRTGRAGMDGQALSLVSMEERPLLRDINKLLGRQVSEMPVEGMDLEQENPAIPAKRSQPAERRNTKQRPPRSAGRQPGPARAGKKPAVKRNGGQNKRRSGFG